MHSKVALFQMNQPGCHAVAPFAAGSEHLQERDLRAGETSLNASYGLDQIAVGHLHDDCVHRVLFRPGSR